MELFAKVVSTGSKSLSLNTSPELLVNIKNGRITASNPVTDKLTEEGQDLLIGFGYDANKDMGSLAYLYVTAEGCKVGKTGTVSSKFHADKLKEAFLENGSETTRFKLNIDLENPVDYEGTSLYPISLKEELKDLVRTQKSATEVEEVSNDTAVEVEAVLTHGEETDATPDLSDSVNEELNTSEEGDTQDFDNAELNTDVLG